MEWAVMGWCDMGWAVTVPEDLESGEIDICLLRCVYEACRCVQAASLAAGIRSTPASVFLGLIAKEGPVAVSNLATITKVVSFCSRHLPLTPYAYPTVT